MNVTYQKCNVCNGENKAHDKNWARIIAHFEDSTQTPVTVDVCPDCNEYTTAKDVAGLATPTAATTQAFVRNKIALARAEKIAATAAATAAEPAVK
jgi:hypothetical protein